MSVLHTNNITNYSGTGGPTIEGISTVDSTGFMRLPVGDTRTRLVKDVENIVTDGLVLHLDAGRAESFGGDGTTWRDLSGNGNNGTLVNGVGFTADDGGSLIFDGVDDYASTGKVLIPRTGEYHIEGWIYPNDTNTNKMFVTQYNNTSDSGRFLCFLSQDGNIRMHDGGGSMTGTLQPYSANIWQYVCFQRNSSNECRTYLNAIPSSPGTRTSTLENTNTLIGTRGSNQTGVWYIGKMSNVRIYNKALTPQEIQQNFNALRGRFGI